MCFHIVHTEFQVQKMFAKEKQNMKLGTLRVWHKNNYQVKYTQSWKKKIWRRIFMLRMSWKSGACSLPKGGINSSLSGSFTNMSLTDCNSPGDITHLFTAKFVHLAEKQQHTLWEDCKISNPFKCQKPITSLCMCYRKAREVIVNICGKTK